MDLESMTNEELLAIAGGSLSDYMPQAAVQGEPTRLGTITPEPTPVPEIGVPSPAAGAFDLNSLSNEQLQAIIDTPIEGESAPLSAGETVTGGFINLLSGLTIGAGDEITAGGSAVVDTIGGLFGGGGGSLSENYDARLNQARHLQEGYRRDHPKSALFGTIGGGALAGGGLFGGGTKQVLAKAPSLVGRVIRGAGTGLATGGAAGFLEGEGGALERGKSALTGATWGAGIGAILGGGAYTTNKIIRSKTAKRLKDTFKARASEEIGAIATNVGRSDPKNISRAQQHMLKIIDEATPEELIKAGERIARAEKRNSPITLFEALDVERGYADAKLARVSRGGESVATRFLKDRQKSTGQRVGALLDDISPEDDFYLGNRQFQEGAQEIVDTAKKQRSTIAEPLYKKAAKAAPDIDTPNVDKVLKHPLVKPLVKKQRNIFYDEIPQNASNKNYYVLKAVKKGLEDKAGDAKAAGRRAEARMYAKQAKTLQREIDTFNPSYKIAQNEYKQLSKGINELEGNRYAGQRTFGLLEDILKANPENASAAKKLLTKSPSQIKQITQVFKRNGKMGALKAGLRSAFQREVDLLRNGALQEGTSNPADKILKNANIRANLKAILGADEAEDLMASIEVEGLIQKGTSTIGTNLKNVGSNTQLLQTRRGKIIQAVKKGLRHPVKTAEELVDRLADSEDEILSREIAEEMFKPATTKEYNNLLKFKTDLDEYRRAVDAAIQAGETGLRTGEILGGLDGEDGYASPILAGASALGAGAGLFLGDEEQQAKPASNLDLKAQGQSGQPRGNNTPPLGLESMSSSPLGTGKDQGSQLQKQNQRTQPEKPFAIDGSKSIQDQRYDQSLNSLSNQSSPNNTTNPETEGNNMKKIKKDEGFQYVESALNDAGIDDPLERAQFLGQLGHESMGFTRLEEIGGGKKYEGREDLGNTEPGDGERYKGRGFIQLTGRANYRDFGELIGVDLENNPELASDPEIAAQIAVAYWNNRVKPRVKDFNDTTRITKLINGGTNGLADRKKRFAKFRETFNV